jgi:hypothetical protein
VLFIKVPPLYGNIQVRWKNGVSPAAVKGDLQRPPSRSVTRRIRRICRKPKGRLHPVADHVVR